MLLLIGRPFAVASPLSVEYGQAVDRLGAFESPISFTERKSGAFPQDPDRESVTKVSCAYSALSSSSRVSLAVSMAL